MKYQGRGRPRVVPKNHKKKWTLEEEDLLLKIYGSVKMVSMMKRFNRSKGAIIQKYRQLVGFQDMHAASCDYTPTEIAEAIGVDRRTIHNWIRCFGLIASQRMQRDKETGSQRFLVKPRHFWEWAAKNKERIPFQKVRLGMLELEPKWFIKEVEIAKASSVVNINTNWTKEEDKMAYRLLKRGKTAKEIAEELGRPLKGTQRRLTYLKKKKAKAG